MEYFKNDRYMTPGIKNSIPAHIALALWDLIDTMTVEKDYLQIFKLEVIGSDDAQVQVIRHEQEVPEYHSPLIYIPYGPYYTGKVYIIDDGTISLMCLPEER